ncbi:MAG: hypothetical protein AB8Y71_02810 [Coxiella endosymbiont of Haemaphysalis qinghaiensis]
MTFILFLLDALGVKLSGLIGISPNALGWNKLRNANITATVSNNYRTNIGYDH